MTPIWLIFTDMMERNPCLSVVSVSSVSHFASLLQPAGKRQVVGMVVAVTDARRIAATFRTMQEDSSVFACTVWYLRQLTRFSVERWR